MFQEQHRWLGLHAEMSLFLLILSPTKVVNTHFALYFFCAEYKHFPNIFVIDTRIECIETALSLFFHGKGSRECWHINPLPLSLLLLSPFLLRQKLIKQNSGAPSLLLFFHPRFSLRSQELDEFHRLTAFTSILAVYDPMNHSTSLL